MAPAADNASVVIVWLSVMWKNIAKSIDDIKQKPDDKPLTPSMRLMAFIIPTAAKMVCAYDRS